MIGIVLEKKQYISINFSKRMRFAMAQWEINCKYGTFFMKMLII